MEELNALAEDPNLWNDAAKAQALMKERTKLDGLIKEIDGLKSDLDDNIELIELGGEYTKAEICQVLMNHPKFQSEDQQNAIYEFVVRNCREIKSEIEAKLEASELEEAL